MVSEPPGSSPLARGLQIAGQAGDVSIRIIPARAGFTSARSAAFAASRDHPRSRGVYASKLTDLGEVYGSSPLARGLLLVDESPLFVPRIIPARAGFTKAAKRLSTPHPDHPRSRGVYS